MNEPTRVVSVEEIAKLSDYSVEAFLFVREGLQFARRDLYDSGQKVAKHITGQQLCMGLKKYAIHRWGLMAKTVLEQWNIRSTMDFGRIVFLLIDSGWMAKSKSDRIEDFTDVFDFEVEFGNSVPLLEEIRNTQNEVRVIE